MIVPAIIGATGLVKMGLKKNLEAMPGKQSIESPNKTVVLGTSHVIWKGPLVQEKYQGQKEFHKLQ